jgi:P27 family predicted phage terminase small subunit
MRPEVQPAIESTCPEPPSCLDGYGRDEWWRLGPELRRLGLLTLVDVAPLAAYCAAYSRWRTASEVLAGMRERDQLTHGLLIKTMEGNPRRNPLVKIVADSADAMVRYAGEFGMTPLARSRLAAGIGGQPAGPSKFDGLIG